MFIVPINYHNRNTYTLIHTACFLVTIKKQIKKQITIIEDKLNHKKTQVDADREIYHSVAYPLHMYVG